MYGTVVDIGPHRRLLHEDTHQMDICEESMLLTSPSTTIPTSDQVALEEPNQEPTPTDDTTTPPPNPPLRWSSHRKQLAMILV